MITSSTRKGMLLISTIIVVIAAFFVVFIDQAAAEQPSIADASVTNTTTDSAEQNTTAALAPINSTKRAPVSISNYSDEVTESADTYIYNGITIGDNNIPDSAIPTPSAIPYTDNNSNPNNNFNNPVPTATPGTNNNFTLTNQVIIGDSRTVGMNQTVGDNGHTWSCKVAMGLKWMKETGVPAVENNIKNGTAVIILMGINDLYNNKNYIEYINQKAAEWASKGAKTYFVSVNPINESTYTTFNNTAIEEFNTKMIQGLRNVEYIDTYNYLQTHDCSYTSDGLHYNSSTSKKIYDLIQATLISSYV